MFNAKEIKNGLVLWIRDWFDENGPGCNCVCGISGGKDSSVVAALCVEALGPDRVIGVMMPQGGQKDIDMSHKLVRHLGIRHMVVDINDAYCAVINDIIDGMYNQRQYFPEFRISNQTKTNLPPRIRMATLYAIAQTLNGRVSNNCNLSEDWVGYSTRWGDAAGDFAPLANLTVTEVKAIGYELGLPVDLIEKVPSDGLCGKTDEDNLGFSYEVLDRYIREGICEDKETEKRIIYLHNKNLFKMRPIPRFSYDEPI